MTNESTELATAAAAERTYYEGLVMVTTGEVARQRLQQLQSFVADVMVKDVDYGTIPGTRQPTLLKPGGEKLCEIYGFAPHYDLVEAVKDWAAGFFYFEYKCSLTSRRDGSHVTEGIGSCNSQESKYAGRWMPESDVPPGMNRSALKSKTEGAWLFKSKIPHGIDLEKLPKQERSSTKGGKYFVYQLVVTQYFVPNTETASLVNTLQKMAQKRAFIAAVISATRSSGIFTQDVEDLPASALGTKETPPHDPETGEIKDDKKDTEATPEQTKRYDERQASIAQAPDVATIRKIGDECIADAKANRIAVWQLRALRSASNERKKLLEEIAKEPSLDVGKDPAGLAGPEPPADAGDAWEPPAAGGGS